MASADLVDKLPCSICLNLYRDPVTLRCGHNFCRVCIDQHLNTQDGSGVYSCPECREEFQERPALQRNITLCNVVENFLEHYCMNIIMFIPLDIRHFLCHFEELDVASEFKKGGLRNVLQKLTTQREEIEERVQSLEKHWRKSQEKAAEEAERVTALFIDIRRRLDDLEKRVLNEISRKEEQMLLFLSDVIQKLEIKKDELSREMRNIEEKCNMTDPLTLLQEPDTGDLCDPEEGGGDEDTGGHDGGDEDTGGHDGADEDTGGHDGGDEDTGGHDGGDEDTGGHDGDDRGVERITRISHTLSDIIRGVNVTFCVQDPADILLDVNTAANNLLISDDLKTATWTDIKQNRPETAKRFQNYHQVISSKIFFSRRHYWDVEISGSRWWRVGMCYPSIDRRGRKSNTGENNKSWCLYGGQVCTSNQCSVVHDGKKIRLPHQISSNRFRIYVDYEAGQLSFYELCDPIRHLHTFTATFTEPLHAALSVLMGSIKILGGWQEL